MSPRPEPLKRLTIRELLKPHRRSLALGLIAVIGEGITGLLEPWPLKVVLDNVVKGKQLTSGWLNHFIYTHFGDDRLTVLKFAAVAALVIAILGALCAYTEKVLTTSIGQWVMHDLRRSVYFHIQRLSLSFHDHRQSGDLISRVTSDIDAIQSFIASGLLSSLVNT